MTDVVAVPLFRVLASTGTGPTSPCPSCQRPSRLTDLDGGDCLTCGTRKAAARILGEGVASAAIDNIGIGWRDLAGRPLARVS